MRVRVSYVVEVSDEYRRAINRFYGRSGKAKRADVQQWFRDHGDTMDDDLITYYGDDSEGAAAQEGR